MTCTVGQAQVPGEQLLQPQHVADGKGLVQTKIRLQRGPGGRAGGVFPPRQVGNGGGGHIHEKKDEEGDAEKHRERTQNTFYKILCQNCFLLHFRPERAQAPKRALRRLNSNAAMPLAILWGAAPWNSRARRRLNGGLSGWGSLWGSPYVVGTGGNGALPGGALFLWRNRGKNTKGKEVPSPWNPILWWEDRGKVVPSGRGLACGLQDQRLMARPPARAGGRSGLLTEGKTGTRTVTLCLFPKGTHPRPQPAQPVGGPLRTFQCEGRRPGIP